MSIRPKRKAAEKVAIIEISDSEDEAAAAKSVKKTRREPKTRRIDEVANLVASKGKKQRWPDKEKRSVLKESRANTKRNQSAANEVIAEDAIATEVDRDNTATSITANNENNMHNQSTASTKTTGRNSFWARRKVWTIPELLAETQNINAEAARNIVQLFENENTIPFICRYRRDLVNHMTPDDLREIKNSYTEILGLRKRAENIVTQLEKENVVDEDVRNEMLCAKTTEELEFLYSPYKQASKGSLAERAKALGLEVYADRLLYGEAPAVNVATIIDYNNADLDSEEKVLNGICNIITHNIAKHTGVLEELRRLQKVNRILLKCTKTKTPTAASSAKEKSNAKVKVKLAASTSKGNKNDQSKFETYFNYQNDVRYLKPHQVLAINRGEKLKFLSVKIIIDDYLKLAIKRYVQGIFWHEGMQYPLRSQIAEKSFEECYAKKLQPLLSRQIRSDLNESAKKASIEVFAKNLKQLFLISPLKGERILGIDPGFTNGCKLALISETADVLETGVIYPHSRQTNIEQCGEQLAKMLIRHNCKIIALGNGTACRETEFWLSKLLEMGILDSRFVRYSIVSEQGASIYSCSEVAKKEFPNMDLNEISAVSIARRLNDPLSEYVKIDPRHIGVGMYQHDINEKLLNESLGDVVSECVSYVGVDINTASLSVLKHIAGLTEKKAEKIIQYRLDNGIFRTRKDLLQVKSIGEKTYIQCAGFIRIEPRSVGGKIDNLLDCTWVHPESYVVAKKIISKCKLNLDDIGSNHFIAAIKNYANSNSIDELANDFKIPKERLDIVLVALQRELFQDYRSDFDKRPLFKHGVAHLADLSEGDVVTGAVTNVTHFGAFVDIGVECDALIHISKMNNTKLSIGDRVTASIAQVDVQRKRINLRLEEMITDTNGSFSFEYC